MGDISASNKGTETEDFSTVHVNEEDSTDMLSTKTAAALLEKLKEFRQSFNRTQGQVCEFFEQAHVVEKLHNRAPGKSVPVAKASGVESEDEGDENESKEEDDHCTEQKTSAIKKKLNSWRAVMREVVFDVCPNLRLENQPDINPGLMKHVLDEIRKLKTELAFQHNTILELTLQLDDHKNNNKQKDDVIKNLLEKRKLLRLGRDQQSREMKEFKEDKEVSLSQEDPHTTVLEFGSIGPCFDLRTNNCQFPESFHVFDEQRLQEVKGMELGRKEDASLVGKTEQQHTMDNVFGSNQTPIFTNNPTPKDTIESPCFDSVPNEKIVPVEPPPKSCFENVNKGGVSTDSRKVSPDPLVIVHTPESNYEFRSHSGDITDNRPHLVRRIPLMRTLVKFGGFYFLGRALNKRLQK